jgi:hypothetical protein
MSWFGNNDSTHGAWPAVFLATVTRCFVNAQRCGPFKLLMVDRRLFINWYRSLLHAAVRSLRHTLRHGAIRCLRRGRQRFIIQETGAGENAGAARSCAERPSNPRRYRGRSAASSIPVDRSKDFAMSKARSEDHADGSRPLLETRSRHPVRHWRARSRRRNWATGRAPKSPIWQNDTPIEKVHMRLS